jgi:hypothetical protein
MYHEEFDGVRIRKTESGVRLAAHLMMLLFCVKENSMADQGEHQEK